MTRDDAVAVRGDHGFRPDVQGLRAVAVGLVVIYHLWPGALPGGYVGVDVFFVISGYLITGMLLREYERTGRVRLLDFYARRARRLLPAAALVLLVTWLLSRVLLPVTALADTATQIRASALYFQNWVLASDSVDYLKSDQAASPVQHYWSLSVEEQFYLLWPLLFLLAAGVALGHPRRRRVALAVLAGGVVAASLWYSVHETAADPAAAYFVTPTRLWELGLGGVLAMAPAALMRLRGRTGPLSWLGLGLIVFSAVALSDATSFPGAVALLPTLGTALVLAFGAPGHRFGTGRVASLRPLTFLGGISYSLYLWHWPVLVLAAAWAGTPLGGLQLVGVLAASVLLATLTKRFVEDPIRTARFVARSRVRSLATMTTAIIPVALVSVFLAGQGAPHTSTPNASHPGAAVLAGSTHATPAQIIPALNNLSADTPTGITPVCEVDRDTTTVKTCRLGDTTSPQLTVALVGDSHAGQWSDALAAIGKERHWEIVVAAKSECPMTATEVAWVGEKTPYTECSTWGKSLMTQLTTTIKPDVVIATDRAYNSVLPSTTADAASRTAVGQGMATYWRQLMAQGIGVVAIHETPEPGQNVATCLASRGGSNASCSVARKDAFGSVSPVEVAAAQLDGAVSVVDLTPLFCTDNTCPAVVGNVLVYIDGQHLTRSYTLTLQPYLEKELLDGDDDLARAT